jgi:hypothetical protein
MKKTLIYTLLVFIIILFFIIRNNLEKREFLKIIFNYELNTNNKNLNKEKINNIHISSITGYDYSIQIEKYYLLYNKILLQNTNNINIKNLFIMNNNDTVNIEQNLVTILNVAKNNPDSVYFYKIDIKFKNNINKTYILNSKKTNIITAL